MYGTFSQVKPSAAPLPLPRPVPSQAKQIEWLRKVADALM